MIFRIKISSLSDKMVELQGNILEFHSYVRGIVNDLAAYGTTSTELHVNVLWAYAVVEDESFCRFELPSETRILPCVWAMKRKRDLVTGEITKWKA